MSTIDTSSTLRHTAWVLRGNPVTAIAAALALLLAFVAIFAPWLAPYDPIASDVSSALQPPSALHWAGTDQLGRDVFSRLLVATTLDLAIAITAVAVSFAFGAVIGALCGYGGGRVGQGGGRFVGGVVGLSLVGVPLGIVG